MLRYLSFATLSLILASAAPSIVRADDIPCDLGTNIPSANVPEIQNPVCLKNESRNLLVFGWSSVKRGRTYILFGITYDQTGESIFTRKAEISCAEMQAQLPAGSILQDSPCDLITARTVGDGANVLAFATQDTVIRWTPGGSPAVSLLSTTYIDDPNAFYAAIGITPSLSGLQDKLIFNPRGRFLILDGRNGPQRVDF